MDRYREIVPDWERFQETIRTPQPNDVRVNTLEYSVAEMRELLDEEDVSYEQRSWHPWFFSLAIDPGKSFAHWLGAYYVQESVSGIPPLALDPQPGESVADICAAPGSKTTQMAAMMENRGEILANDRRPARTRSLLANCYRLGVLNAQVIEQDARNLPEGKKYDRVLVDAPCSAEGNVREQPELQEGAAMEDIEGLADLQEQLLEKAFRLCKPGGTVVYSTCTFAPEENELVVREFLERGRLMPLSFGFEHADGITSWEGEELDPRLANCVRVWPHQLDSGGIFVARFEKEA